MASVKGSPNSFHSYPALSLSLSLSLSRMRIILAGPSFRSLLFDEFSKKKLQRFGIWLASSMHGDL